MCTSRAVRKMLRPFGALLLCATAASAQTSDPGNDDHVEAVPFTVERWEEGGLRGWQIANDSAVASGPAELVSRQDLADLRMRVVLSLDRDESDVTLLFRVRPEPRSLRGDAFGVRFVRNRVYFAEMVALSNGSPMPAPLSPESVPSWRDGTQEVDVACRGMVCVVTLNGRRWVSLPAAHPSGAFRIETQRGGLTVRSVVLTPPVPEVPPWSEAEVIDAASGATPPKVKSGVRPKYDAGAMRRGVQGAVWVECVVDAKGRVVAARIVRPLDSTLDAVAIQTAKQWQFDPARDAAGQLVAARIVIEMSFKLKK